MRSLIRIAAFGASLLLLALLPGRGTAHPSTTAAQWACVILGVSIFRSLGFGLRAAVAQFAMYVAVLAPLFWVKRLHVDTQLFRRVLLILWLFHSASAVIGVLQVYFPDQFQTQLSSVYTSGDTSVLAGLQIETASGERIFRPMGLTDMPGGAATAGFYAVLLGTGFLLSARRPWMRLLCAGSMLAGFTCIYLCETRYVLVMLALCLVGFCGLLWWRGERAKFATMAVLLGVLTVAGFTWAFALTGGGFVKRLGTLVNNDATDVYYSSRGIFLEHTINDLLPEYPLGAGPGRWGMINYYFGDHTPGEEIVDRETAPIWVEIQWTGWLLDGGAPLILAYFAAIAIALWTAWKIATARHIGILWIWGAVLMAYDVGALAATFDYPYFHGQNGLEFWLLNAALFAAWRKAVNDRKPLAAVQS